MASTFCSSATASSPPHNKTSRSQSVLTATATCSSLSKSTHTFTSQTPMLMPPSSTLQLSIRTRRAGSKILARYSCIKFSFQTQSPWMERMTEQVLWRLSISTMVTPVRAFCVSMFWLAVKSLLVDNRSSYPQRQGKSLLELLLWRWASLSTVEYRRLTFQTNLWTQSAWNKLTGNLATLLM